MTLTLPAGRADATARMTLAPLDDDIDGPAETETVRITAVNATPGSGLRLEPSSLEVTIEDDDVRGLVVSSRSLRVNRSGEARYTVRLASEPRGDVTVMPDLSAPPGVEVSPSTLTFTADDWNVAQTVTVAVAPGTTYQAGETAAIGHEVSGADYGGVAGPEVVASLVYRAPPPPPPPPDELPVALAVSPAEVPEGGGAAEVTVTAVLEAAREAPTQIVVAVSGGTAEAATDFAPVPEFTVTIPAGETHATGTFTFAPVDDAVDEDDETLTVDATGTGLTVSPATLTLTDDDERGLALSRVTLDLDAEGVGSYTVALKSQPTGEVTVTPVVTVTRSGPGSAVARATRAKAQANEAVTVTPPALTFTEEDWDVPQTVTVRVALEMLQGDETLAIAHTVSGADYDDLDAPSTGDPPEPVVISPTVATVVLAVDPETVPEGGGAAEVTVTAALQGEVRPVPTEIAVAVIGETAEAETDFAEVPGFTVTIPAGESQGTRMFTFTPVDDAIDEGDGETVRIEATTADSRVSLAPSSLEVTIEDDDERGLRLSMDSVGVDAEGVARWHVSLRSQPTGEVVVSVTAPDAPPRVSVATSSLTFTPSNWSLMQWATLRVPPGRYRGDESAAVVHTPEGADYSPALRRVVTVSLGGDAVAETVPAAWLSRFGRTVAGQAVDMVGSRLEDGGSPHVRLGVIGRLGDGGTWVEPAHEERTWTGLETRLEAERMLSARELLLGSSFRWHTGGEAGAPAWTGWGRFAAGGFEADEDRIRMDGDVTSAFLGMDVAHERWLAGLAVAVSEGDGDYELLARDEAGEVESSLMSLYPYGRYRLTDRVDVWGLAGYGAGAMTLAGDAGRTETDIEMQMGAVGARAKVLEPLAGLSVAVKTDALWLRVSSEAARDARGGDLGGAGARVSRLRLVVEGTRSFELGGGTLTPTVEFGLRHDAGDAETGAGAEVGGGLRFAGDRFTLEGSVRGLIAHEESGYEEWGASGALRIDPAASGRGFSLTLAPQWGAASSGMDRLWSRRDTGGLVPEDGFEAGSRFETEVGYGLRAPLELGVLTPYTGLSLSEGGGRTWRLGSRWEVAPGAALGLEASREEGGDDALMLRGRLRW